jgi:CYTH domain-containing protein
MIELELTYLAKSLPSDLTDFPSKKIVDLYVENGTDHADLRIRRNGDKYELTRKTPVSEGDASKQEETTIQINAEEFESFQSVKNRKIGKTRYFFQHEDITAEFDVFEGDLAGLVVIDFEFKTETEKNSFKMPDFCLIDITQEKFIAGGVLAGKNLDNLNAKLQEFGYQRLYIN